MTNFRPKRALGINPAEIARRIVLVGTEQYSAADTTSNQRRTPAIAAWLRTFADTSTVDNIEIRLLWSEIGKKIQKREGVK